MTLRRRPVAVVLRVAGAGALAALFAVFAVSASDGPASYGPVSDGLARPRVTGIQRLRDVSVAVSSLTAAATVARESGQSSVLFAFHAQCGRCELLAGRLGEEGWFDGDRLRWVTLEADTESVRTELKAIASALPVVATFDGTGARRDMLTGADATLASVVKLLSAVASQR